jgi:hypothetical protein
MPDSGQRLRHIKRGSEYEVIGLAHLQTDKPLTDMEPMVVYRGEDGKLWVRPETEFTPDRFVLLT